MILIPNKSVNNDMVQVSARQAITEWTKALGAPFVITEQQVLNAAAQATFSTSQRIPTILRPANREEIRECLRIANQFGAPLYPVSSGKNWGYGSRVPAEDGSALLDLGRLDRITDFSEELGYVTVEPGVTQRQLYQFLQEKGGRLWMDATGSSPDCSLIGNTMERGFGHTPYGDHFSNVCGLEVILPSGEIVQTGFGSFPGAKTGPVYRWGVGPSLDGLFSQSNFGIVTRMTIWLMPKPEHFQAFFFQCSSDEKMEAAVEAVRPLRLDGTLRSAVHIANDYRVLAGTQRFPWGEPMPLSRDRMTQIRRDMRFGRWNGSGALYGTKGQVAEARRLLKRALKGKAERLQFLDDRIFRLAQRFQTPYRWITGIDLGKVLDLAKPVYGLLQGVPTDRTLNSAYWRKKTIPAQPNPDRDRCGVIWCAPVAPLRGTEALHLAQLTERIMLQHGFEPMMSITLLTERSLACIVSITYDRDGEGEDEKAMRCYRELQTELNRGGYFPYRLGIQSMETLSGRTAYSDLLKTFKNTLDPNNVLAPGRYSPPPADVPERKAS